MKRIDIEKFYDFEMLGVQAANCSRPRIAKSLDNKKAMNLMENSCKRVNIHNVIGLPWKKDKTLLPDNHVLAETWLRLLKEFKKESRQSENVHQSNNAVHGKRLVDSSRRKRPYVGY